MDYEGENSGAAIKLLEENIGITFSDINPISVLLCQSKAIDKWRLVQDLQIINEAVVPLHPVVPIILYCLKFLNEPNTSQ